MSAPNQATSVLFPIRTEQPTPLAVKVFREEARFGWTTVLARLWQPEDPPEHRDDRDGEPFEGCRRWKVSRWDGRASEGRRTVSLTACGFCLEASQAIVQALVTSARRWLPAHPTTETGTP